MKFFAIGCALMHVVALGSMIRSHRPNRPEVVADITESIQNPISTIAPNRLENDRVPSGYPMKVGDKVRVQVEVKFQGAKVYMGLCGDTSCSTIRLDGHKKGVLGYSTWRVFVNTPSTYAGDSVAVDEPTGPWLFTKDETIIFEVSLGADGLSVIVEGDQTPVRATIVPQPDETDLKIQSEVGSAVLLDAGQVTDGLPMAVGEQMAVQFCVTPSPSGAQEAPGALLMVGLCSSKDCGFIVVYGLDQDGGLRYGTAVSLLRNQFTGLSDWIETPEWTNSTFTGGEQRVLVVSRCSDTQLQVWLQDRPGDRISVPLTAQRSILREEGHGGNVLLHRVDAGPYTCPPTTTSPTPTTPFQGTSSTPVSTPKFPTTTSPSTRRPASTTVLPSRAASNVLPSVFVLLTGLVLHVTHSIGRGFSRL